MSRRPRIAAFAASALVLLATTACTRQQQEQSGMPAGMAHEEHTAQMQKEQPDHFAHRFENPADYAERFDDPARDAWQMPERVIAALEIQPGQVVADIGAGTGYFTIRLAQSPAAPKVYAVDIEAAMVEHIRNRATQAGLTNIVGVKADADRTHLPEAVDVVLIVDTFHHLPDRGAYFTALKGLMKPGARLAIVDWRKDSPEGPPVEFRFTPEQITAELSQAGFTLAASHDFLPRQHFLIYRPR